MDQNIKWEDSENLGSYVTFSSEVSWEMVEGLKEFLYLLVLAKMRTKKQNAELWIVKVPFVKI